METITNVANTVATTATNAATTVAATASKAIYGEPVAGKTDEKSTPKDLPVNDTAPHVLQSSVPIKDPEADAIQATKIEPLVPAVGIAPTTTETLESTHIAPLGEAKPESTLRKAEERLPGHGDGQGQGQGLMEKVEEKLHVGEEKGESGKTADVTPPTAEKTAAPVTTGDHKMSLKEKIKAKLHKH